MMEENKSGILTVLSSFTICAFGLVSCMVLKYRGEGPLVPVLTKAGPEDNKSTGY